MRVFQGDSAGNTAHQRDTFLSEREAKSHQRNGIATESSSVVSPSSDRLGFSTNTAITHHLLPLFTLTTVPGVTSNTTNGDRAGNIGGFTGSFVAGRMAGQPHKKAPRCANSRDRVTETLEVSMPTHHSAYLRPFFNHVRST